MDEGGGSYFKQMQYKGNYIYLNYKFEFHFVPQQKPINLHGKQRV